MNEFRPDPMIRILRFFATFTWWAVWVAGVIFLVLLPLADALNWPDGAKFGWLARVKVPDGKLEVALSTWGIESAPLEGVSGQVALFGGPLSAKIFAWSAMVGMWAMYLFMLYNLRRLLLRIQQGTAFDEQNARHLKWIGAAIVVGEVWSSVSLYAVSVMAVSHFETHRLITLTPHFDLESAKLFLGFSLLILAQIFVRGARLEEEQALTV